MQEDSCPLTGCQQRKLEKWTKQGNDRMSTSSDESAQSMPTPPAKSTPAPTLRPLAPGDRTPTPTAVWSDDKVTAKPLQSAVASSTKQRQPPDNKGTTSVDHLSSSARTRARAGVTPQPVVGTNPLKEKTEKACNDPTGTTKPVGKTSRRPAEAAKPAEKIPDGLTKAKRPVANITGQTKTPGTSDSKKTVAEQILHKLARTETRPEGRPRTGTDEPDKKEATSQGAPETTKQDRKDTRDSDEVLITHDDREQTRPEAAQPGTKGKYSTESKSVTSNTGKIHRCRHPHPSLQFR